MNPTDQRAIEPVPGKETQRDERIEGHLAVPRITVGRAGSSLEVVRREDMSFQDGFPDPEGVPRERLDHETLEGLLVRVPIALPTQGKNAKCPTLGGEFAVDLSTGC